MFFLLLGKGQYGQFQKLHFLNSCLLLIILIYDFFQNRGVFLDVLPVFLNMGSQNYLRCRCILYYVVLGAPRFF